MPFIISGSTSSSANMERLKYKNVALDTHAIIYVTK